MMEKIDTLCYKLIYILFGVIFVKPNFIKAQQFTGSVLSVGSNKEVPYAFITNSKRTIGTTADESGKFFISDLSKYDSIVVSSIGYESTIQPIETSKTIFYLKELSINLPPVFIKRPVDKFKIIGTKTKFPSGSYGGALSSKNELAILISNEDSTSSTLSNVYFYIQKDGVFNAKFRIRIYQIDQNKPGKELTRESIIVKASKKRSWNKFDLLKYNIGFPKNGFFVSIEWLNVIDNYYRMQDEDFKNGVGPTIGMTDEIPILATFMRSNEGAWYSAKDLFILQYDKFDIPTEYYPMIRAEFIY